MRTTKLVIGIVTLVFAAVIMFQSCAVVFLSAATSETVDTSWGAGIVIAVFFIIAGIVGIAARKSKGGGITAGIFFILASIVGFTNSGTFKDLPIWAVLALAFGIVFIIGSIIMPKTNK